jgi:hypothetical protein
MTYQDLDLLIHQLRGKSIQCSIKTKDHLNLMKKLMKIQKPLDH